MKRESTFFVKILIKNGIFNKHENSPSTEKYKNILPYVLLIFTYCTYLDVSFGCQINLSSFFLSLFFFNIIILFVPNWVTLVSSLSAQPSSLRSAHYSVILLLLRNEVLQLISLLLANNLSCCQ